MLATMKPALPTMPQALVAGKREVSQALTEYLARRQSALDAFARGGRVTVLWRALTTATDALLAQEGIDRGVTLVALGGYGRRELYPYSDVDILILLPEHAPSTAPVIALLQRLWDYNIPVSHAVRSVEATIIAAQADSTIATALMDARHIAGDRDGYQVLKRRLRREVYGTQPRAYVEAKLAERDRRHEKWGDSRFVLEPHVKDGKGGLRDLQTLTWLARYCYGLRHAADLVAPDLLTAAERAHTREAYLFFAAVRAHLHDISGRAEERLTFDAQTEIAERLGFEGATRQEKAERFMQRYFAYARHVGALTRIFCAQLEEEHVRASARPRAVQEAIQRSLPEYLVIDHGRIAFSAAADFAQHPQQMLGLFAEAQLHGLDIHPKAQLYLARCLPKYGAQLSHHAESQRLLLSILLSSKAPALSLRRMNDMNVLSAAIPEFSAICGQMQYDGYHTFTVDEHTLEAIANLRAVEDGVWAEQFPLATAVAEEISDRAPLYLAVLCHDIAKGQGGGHASKGGALSKEIAQRMGISNAQAELVSWLVEHHLLLSETAFKRDLDDPKTIADFVATVQSPERLRLLLLVTVADIKAVGPSIWNGWKGSLMRELYTRAMAAMGIGSVSATPQEEEYAALKAYEASGKQPAVRITTDRFRAITEITCCAENQPGFFRVLCGVMAWIGASIVSARVQVTKESMVIASVGIQDVHGNAFEESSRLRQLPPLLVEGLQGKLAFADELPRRRLITKSRGVAVKAAVFVDNQVSAECSVIEVNAKDRLGLLYDILGALDACQLQLMSAHIATYGKKAVDVFYVKDAYGHKVTHPAKLQQIQKALVDDGAL